MRIVRVIVVCLLLMPRASIAQESLDRILDRGHITQWLVCGPFDSDVRGGVLAALRDERSLLGREDFMTPIGGVARARPQHLLEVRKGSHKAIWQRAGVDGSLLDLAPFFPDVDEGVSFAAFYGRSNRSRSVYLDLQTTLGARVFFNGIQIRDITIAPLSSTGVDRFVVEFQAGLNLILIELPGARLSVLAGIQGQLPREFVYDTLANRPLLAGKSGYELALAIHPVKSLEDLVYSTRLESTGTFSGNEDDPQQDLLLTLFNPMKETSGAVTVRASVRGGGLSSEQVLAPVPPETQRLVRLSVPLGTTAQDESLRVHVELESGRESGTFEGELIALDPVREGTVYVITGTRRPGIELEDQSTRVEHYLAHYRNQVALMEQEPDYGFDLGNVGLWKPAFTLYPELGGAVKQGVAQSRTAARSGYGLPDQRLVDGELLIQDLWYGYRAGDALLGGWNTGLLLWDAPAIAPQYPQLLADAGIIGVIENLPHAGLPALFRHIGIDGSAILHRRKRAGPEVRSIGDLRRASVLQRGDLLAQQIETDILIDAAGLDPPDSFWLGAPDILARAMPSVRVTGDGARRFLQEVQFDLNHRPRESVAIGRSLTNYHPGELLAQPDIKAAHVETQRLVSTAERWATIAALMGAEYPEAALDHAWRQLLFNSTPGRLAFHSTTRNYIDALAGYREAADRGRSVLEASTGYIARQVDTYTDAPSQEVGYHAILVFNASSTDRSGRCEVQVELDQAAGFALFDAGGAPVPYFADRLQVVDRKLLSARVQFVARDVPAFGYRTYYVASEGYLPQPDVSAGNRIENEFFEITVDPKAGGRITRVLDKRSGRVVNPGPWNDLVALSEDPERTDGGRELWTTGVATRSSDQSAKIDRFRVEGMERLTATLPFLGGKAVREITLYEGLPYIFCETRLEGIDAKDTVVGVTLKTDTEASVPVFGERFGAIVGRFGPEPLVFRTRDMENPSGTGAQPSHQWVAVSANDGVRLRDDTLVPFMPTAVVYGSSDFLLEDVAREVQQALVHRAIPVDVWPDVLPEAPDGWTDATPFPSFDADLNHGTAFRILVGGPKHNALTQSLFRRMEEPVSKLMDGQTLDDGITLWSDTDVPEGRPPVPTLVIAGSTVKRSVELASSFARSVASNGSYRLLETTSPSKIGNRSAPHGFALIHPGSMLSSVERDGTLFLGLLHGSTWEADADELGVPSENRTQQFSYVLYPFEGSWRQAGVPRVAESLNRRFTTLQTDLHLGQLTRTFGFMTVSPPEWIVTHLAPSAVGLAGLRTKAVSPAEGILLRGYASKGTSIAGTIDFAAGIASAARANVFGRPDAAMVPDRNRIAFHASGFDITTIQMRPGRGLPRGPAEQLAPDVDPYGPVYTRYWRHNIGAAPLGNQPITVAIEGGSESDAQQVTIKIANNARDEVAEGNVALSAPPGWRLSPEEFAYTLNPGEHMERDALILRPEGDEIGGRIVARTRFAGRTYQDFWPLDGNEVEFSAAWKRNEVLITIRNRGSIPAEGFVDLVVPVAHWPELHPFAAVSVTPRRATVYVPPFKEERILFQVSEGQLDFSLAAKLAVNGNVQYTRVSAEPEQ